jgi:hypothetical protein
MNKLLGCYRALKIRALEIYHRLGRSVGIFKMRFIRLAVPTHVDIPESFTFDEKKAVSRGRVAPDGKNYSLSYELNWPEIPDAVKLKIKEFDTVLRLYFGGDYLICTANVWRNIGIPEVYRSLDLYSQVWHYDHVVDYQNAQLFVLLTDTTDSHGPFEYIGNPSETDLHPDVEARNGVDSIGGKVVKLTGVRGDGMLFSTGSTPHRAGIPLAGNHRDIMSVAFFPKYAGIDIDAKSLLGTS